MPVVAASARMDHAGHVAVGDQAHRGAGLANGGDQVGVARALEHERGDFLGLHALGLGERDDVLVGGRVEIDDAGRIARADRDLLHIDVGRVQQRAALGHGHDGDGAGHVLGAKRGAFQRIDGDIDLGALLVPDFLADEQHGRFVALALADAHDAVDRQLVQLAAHGIDRGLVGGHLVAAAAQPRSGDRGALRHAHDLDREHAFDQQARLDGDRSHFVPPYFLQLFTF